MDMIYENPMILLPPFRVTSMVSIMAEVLDFNHKMMNIPAMWKHTRGSRVKVAILDTGKPNHVDLHPMGGKSFIPGYEVDGNGHSTHCGGILAAIANNGMGVAGVAPECEDYYGAVLDAQGSGSIANIIKGIRWAVDTVGAKVISMSLGIDASAPRLPELEKACNYAVNQGAVVVCAAGNEAGGVGQPAIYDSVIAVAAVDQNQKHAWFSNIGPSVDFAAGGVKVYSTWLRNGYAKLDGTSMATPALAGVVTLIMADHYQKHQTWLTPQEVYQKLKKIAFDVGPEGFDEQFGHGIPLFQFDEAPGSGSDDPATEPPGSETPETPETPEPQPPTETPETPCDCSLAFPLLGEFLREAADAIEQNKTTDTAIDRGIVAARDYWNRVSKVRVRHANRVGIRRRD